jgi:tRNA nucleotidyltransferase (CCA-adding enzyme)
MPKVNYSKIIKENTFNPKERSAILKKVAKFIDKLNSELKKKNLVAKAVLGGSSAKGTFLKGQFDCDVFVRFSKEYRGNSEKISGFLEPVIKELVSDYERVYGSRDYFKFNKDDIEYEIVPVLDIKSSGEAVNITDVSPLHVEWIKKKIKKKPSITQEVILTKIFLKAQGLYGAESYIRGFSGHVVDILISYYGSFEKLIKNSVEWTKNQVIDVEKYYKKTDSVLLELNKSKISPLIVIDPIDKKRNAAASLSLEKFNLMKQIALAYIESPSESYFIKTEQSYQELKKDAASRKKEDLVVFQMVPKKSKVDVMGAKLLKVFNYMHRVFRENDFIVTEKSWQWDKKDNCLMWFFIKKQELESKKKHTGPPSYDKFHTSLFKIKHPKNFVEDGKICTYVKRKYMTPQILSAALSKDLYVKEKVSKIIILN